MLGHFVKTNRERKSLTQEALASQVAPGETRHVIAFLEQGKRLPRKETLQKIALELGIPEQYWQPFTSEKAKRRAEFEHILNELIGYDATLNLQEESAIAVVEDQLDFLFSSNMTPEQALDELRRILIAYGVPEVSEAFFTKYIGPDAFVSIDAFEEAASRFQKDAIRLFSTFAEGFERMNACKGLTELLLPLQPHSDSRYRARKSLDLIDPISEDRLMDLGYASAETVKTEATERTVLTDFLKTLATDLRKDPLAAEKLSEGRKKKMDSLLRKYKTALEHGLYSQLFKVDPDMLEREAARLAPKDEKDLERIATTQGQGKRNLCQYLTADYVDVYVATSMRTQADFLSVNRFSKALFHHMEIRPLNLRYFDPTQSWIEDRVAKGLVEALMLRRANVTIYMAQKTDTFGKDSEASVSLGLGKPVIVFVPKLTVPGLTLDSEQLASLGRGEMETMIRRDGNAEDADIDASVDDEGVMTRLLTIRLRNITDADIVRVVADHWADFDLAAEDQRFETPEGRQEFRSWLDEVMAQGQSAKAPPPGIKADVVKTLIAIAARFERRARLFREVHPLALQVILSSGVLNGILVVRSVESCAAVLKGLIRNELSFQLESDEDNYRLIERTTKSTIRVISKNKLLQNACKTFLHRG